jgi:hypothetical protein
MCRAAKARKHPALKTRHRITAKPASRAVLIMANWEKIPRQSVAVLPHFIFGAVSRKPLPS